MIIHRTSLDAGNINIEDCLTIGEDSQVFANAVCLDLEHLIYKVPLGIGVFGVCSYNSENNTLDALQYMIQSKQDARKILYIIRDFFLENKDKYIVTFAGKNDFTVINYLFNKHKIKYNFEKNYLMIDLQKEYYKATGCTIGLKELEKIFCIEREGELISGSNLAKTIGKILKVPGYSERMDRQKTERILQYNLQDVVNLFYIMTKWNKYVSIVKK